MVGRLELRDDFKEGAEAKQYPDDKRYLEAAAIFDRPQRSMLFRKTFS
jgi:hypothetical protein